MTAALHLPESTSMLLAETPDEWLLAVFDSYRNDSFRRLHRNHIRPLFELIEDHPGEECPPYGANCCHSTEHASWPTPVRGYALPDG